MYLGRKGAGELFQDYIMNSKLPNVFDAGFCSRKHATEDFQEIVLKLPKSTIGLLNLWKKNEFIREVVKVILDLDFSHVIIPMAHPWDLEIQRRLSSQSRVLFTRILHDAERHPGDLWPRKRSIAYMIGNSRLIFLSLFTKNRILNPKGWIGVANHPYVWRKPTGKVQSNISYDLIIGRHKRYQNTFRVAAWWSNEVSRCFPERQLWIVGKMTIILRLRLKNLNNPKIKIFADWVTDQSFVNYIDSANCLICLYAEASQSGNIELAKYLKVPALVSNVGALPEQISDYERGCVVDLASKQTWLASYFSIGRTESCGDQSPKYPPLEEVIEWSIFEGVKNDK
jgi:hypothetical protein